MAPRVGIVLCARLASARLPGKAMAAIGDVPMLVRCLRRLQASEVGPVVLATTTRRDDDPLAAIAAAHGATVVRGAEHDVLARVAQAVEVCELDVAFRATGDNPAVDIEGPRRLLDRWLARPVDYACEHGLPIGAAVELVTRDAVRRAHDSASSVEDREHVTTFIKASAHKFDVAWPDAPPALTWPDLRLTVDTADDLQYLQRVFAATGSAEPSLLHIIDAARRVPREAAA